MKAIFTRLHRLENAAAPAERERAAVEAILENRRRRLGSDYEPIEYPPDWFAGCRSTADHILRARQFIAADNEKDSIGSAHERNPLRTRDQSA
jgi:hypothetical protein